MSSGNSNQDGSELPGWLGSFLAKPFFSDCNNHEASDNQLKKYSINCDAPLCKHCIDGGAHTNHQVLKVHKNGNDIVVPLDDIHNQFDYSDIQRYRCNRKPVIAIHHSGTRNGGEGRCKTCQSKLINPSIYSYCCIDCKVRASAREAEGNKRKRSRKGTPRRAPLS